MSPNDILVPPAGQTGQTPPSSGSRWSRMEGSWSEWLIPLGCCVLLALQLTLSMRHWSPAYGEATNLYAGYRYWKCGDFSFNPGQPPLPKMVAAAPLLHLDFPINCAAPARNDDHAALDWFYAGPWHKALAQARLAILLFSLGTCLLVWRMARRMFGFTAASLAAALFVFEPNALGQGALIRADMAVTCGLLLAVFLFYQWTRSRACWYLPLAGAAAAITVTAKRSGLLLIPILLLLALLDACVQKVRPRLSAIFANLLAVTLIALIAGALIWPLYGTRFSARPDGTPLIHGKMTGRTTRILDVLGNHHLLPEAYLEGALKPAAYRPTLPMFVLGHLSTRPRWYFYPASLLIRCTVPLLVLLIMATIAIGVLRRQFFRELLFIALPGGVLLLSAMRSGVAGSIRALLPVLPFAVIFIAAGCVHRSSRRARWAPIILAVAVALHAASSLHAAPNYLSYANELWGGPAHAYRWISGSDQGAAYYQVRDYLHRHPGQPCWIASLYPMDIQAYGIPCRQFRETEFEAVPAHFHGTVILSSEFRTGSERQWLYPITQEGTLTGTLGGSAMLVYQGDFDLSEGAALSQGVMARIAMENGQFAIAVQHAQQAVELGPGVLYAHFQYCRALLANGEIDAARIACGVLRSLMEERKRLFIDNPDRPNNKITPQLIAGLTEAMRARQATGQGLWQEALQHAQWAVTLAPESGTAHFEYCKALSAQNTDAANAAVECSTAQALQREFPMTERGWMDPRYDRLALVDLFLHTAGDTARPAAAK